ncbi:MAG TPA: hypothetical protein VF412_14270 [Bdellovibrio sp.]|uniref:hypothetical protein n=1 Tax=Bdellovibrio sp. TaxID=28201 RepID=UPI002EE4AB84
MKPLRGLLGLAIALSSVQVCAQSANVSDVAAGSSLSGGSYGNRQSKNLTMQIQPVGIGAIGTNESEFILGFHLDGNNILQIEAGIGRSDFALNKWDGQSEDKELLKGQSVGFHYKHFLGNSLYVKAGADYREIKYQGEVTSPDFANIEGTSGVASVLIGSQWQWTTLTIGCDWIGGGIPFAQYYSSTYGNSSSAIADAKKKYLETAFLEGMRIYVGASF